MLDFSLVEFLTAEATLARGSVSTGEITNDTPLPALVIERVTGQRNRTLNGRALFARATMNVSAVGASAESALSLIQQVHRLLDGVRGMMGTATRTEIKSCFSEAEPASRTFRDGDLVRVVCTESFRIVYVDSNS
jgi:hypothetical protein